MIVVDDELISAYLDNELARPEQEAVENLLAVNLEWHKRFESFQMDSEILRRATCPELSESRRRLILDLVQHNLSVGSERRRVPRFKRRWLIAAAFLVPVFFTLLFFQNPNQTCRLYLKKDTLELQAGRSIMKQKFSKKKTWVSPRLWAPLQVGESVSVGFQIDTKAKSDQLISVRVDYDFDGNGTTDRKEWYKTSLLDQNLGWERFAPSLRESEGEYQAFQGGTITLTLRVEGDSTEEFELSGTPGELVLPFRGLRTSKGAL